MRVHVTAPKSHRDYHVWSDSDQKCREARIMFLDTETSNWALDVASGEDHWHWFYTTQPDLHSLQSSRPPGDHGHGPVLAETWR
jgi:glycosidase